MAKVKKGNWEFKGEQWDMVSPEVKDLICKLMNKNVGSRLTAVEALAHPWIKKKVKT